MFLKIIHNLFKKSPTEPIFETKVKLYEDAVQKMLANDLSGAVEDFEKFLKIWPSNVEALSVYGSCLADVGKNVEALKTFELAYSLDDTNLAVLSNYAKILLEQKRSAEALVLLRKAKSYAPNYLHVDAVLAAILLAKGDSMEASSYQFRLWLANFDSLRYANGYLLYSIYSGKPEAMLATEHLFWADTLAPHLPSANENKSIQKTINLDKVSLSEVKTLNKNLIVINKKEKIRIGYWSPDFREHSVRFFFAPMLENHDLQLVELYIYHDAPKFDNQTTKLKNRFENFFDVCEKTDDQLISFIQSHELDILVELAGHSSFNRIALLQERMATLQISALGYPPTTGLVSIDAKVMDIYTVTSESKKFYTEYPLVLPFSFWCFDPMEDIPLPLAPPHLANGYITFACVGNTAKITSKILENWKLILDHFPTSRLLIRAINAADNLAKETLLEKLIKVGILIDRVDFKDPLDQFSLFRSYNEIDIILDTFPFNGGTTSCFAAYMGVPIITIAGDSLISRMGNSIMNNLGYGEWVALDDQEYVEKSIKAAKSTDFLFNFRSTARDKFKESSLGNGKKFTKEFELACFDFLKEIKSGVFSYKNEIELHPSTEIINRVYKTLQYNQLEVSNRLLDYCLLHYPNYGKAHIVVAQLYTGDDRFLKSANYLEEKLSIIPKNEHFSVFLELVHYYLLLKMNEVASIYTKKLLCCEIKDSFDSLQVQLYKACCEESAFPEDNFVQPNKVLSLRPIHQIEETTICFQVLIPCNETVLFEFLSKHLEASCERPSKWNIEYVQLVESEKLDVYKDLHNHNDIGDKICIILQKNIEIHNSLFYIEVAETLASNDVVSFSGARCWRRIDWRLDLFDVKAAGYSVASSDYPGGVEMRFFGADQHAPVAVGNMVVLDGRLLAFRPESMKNVALDIDLITSDSTLVEEDWSHTAFKNGARLAVHRNLGVFIHQMKVPENCTVPFPRLHTAEKLGIDVFAFPEENSMALSAPVASVKKSVIIANIFLKA